MLRTPLKNSKSVNKPFKSPFESPAQIKDQSRISNGSSSTKKKCDTIDSPQSSRSTEAKRVLLLDEDEKEIDKSESIDAGTENTLEVVTKHDEREVKRRKLTVKDDVNISKTGTKISKSVIPENATKSDLHVLKRKIFEMRQELDCLKSRERCTKKHNPKDLKLSINKWKNACQNALETLQSEYSEKNGQSCTIPIILKMLGIPNDIVYYSEKDDSFL